MASMKQKYLIALVVIGSVTLLAAGCNSQTSQQQSNSSTTVQNNCEQNRQAILDYLKSEDNKNNTAVLKGNRLTYTSSIQEIFYSPKAQSCAYFYISESTFSSGPNKKSYLLKKFPGNEIQTFQINVGSDSESQTKVNQFNKDLKSYK